MVLTEKNIITVVSGLPRSGTSMMMRMLEVGGLEILTDSIREADESNPNGYYEFERVKKLREGDFQWIEAARGKAVKVISFLLSDLPTTEQYRVIFMQRNMDEILHSQRRMLQLRGETTSPEKDQELSLVFNKHLKQVQNWLDQQPHMKVHYLNYNNLLAQPEPGLVSLKQFLSIDLDIDRMVQVVDGRLYRQRA